jgi:hypothetical protein
MPLLCPNSRGLRRLRAGRRSSRYSTLRRDFTYQPPIIATAASAPKASHAATECPEPPAVVSDAAATAAGGKSTFPPTPACGVVDGWGVNVALGGTGVTVRVAVGAMGVDVRVAVGGTGVFVGGTGVFVGGTGVFVGGTGVFVEVGVGVGGMSSLVSVQTFGAPSPIVPTQSPELLRA